MSESVITIVRHGRTFANSEGIWHGSIDTPLSEHGRLQAERTAEHLRRTRGDAVALYTSPLERARLTAAPIATALGLEPRTRDDLQEYHLGQLEGLSFRELARDHRLFQRMAEEPDWQPGGGESPRQVALRLGRALREVAAAHPGERAIVVSHGGALVLALAWLVEGDLGAWRQGMDNAAVSDLHFGATPELRVFNERAHLDELDGE
jgi:probable phosphoglycerate mutase